MKKNQLGKSDIQISELTLGCMSLGTNKDQAKEIINYALEAGINHLDTADLYDFGQNEEIVGSIIKEKRDQIILTSKVGNHFNKDSKEWFWDPSRKHIESGVKDTLNRLQTDYLDLYLMHGGTIEDPIDEVIDTLEGLKKEGTIRAYGISSIRPNVIREYVNRSNIDAVMMQYSILDRRPEEEMLDLLAKHQISVLSRGPLAKGILSNHGLEILEKKAQEGYLEYPYDELKSIQKQLLNVLPGSMSMNELALKYVLQSQAVSSAVFGASSLQQVKENVDNFSNQTLDEETYHQIQQLIKPIHYKNHRN